MHLGICNLTGSAIKKGVNSNSNEIINICNQLNEKVHCEIVNTCEGDFEFNSVYVEEADPNSYDAFMIMNSHANFFGGVKNEGVLQLYKFLAKLKCPIFYLFNDTNLLFSQLWPQIARRDWNDLTEDDVKITAPFRVITQFKNLDTFIKTKTEKQIPVDEIRFVDFGTWLLKNFEDRMVNNTAEYDLIYGGSFRGGRREEKFKDFFFNKNNISVGVYGSMKASQFKTLTDNDTQPTWLGRVNSTEVIKTNAKGLATVVVGEKNYNNNIETIRLYEAMLAGCVVFIDDSFDNKHVILEDDFHYVKSGKELEEKIMAIKANPELHKACLDRQKAYLEKKAKIDYIDQILCFIKEAI